MNNHATENIMKKSEVVSSLVSLVLENEIYSIEDIIMNGYIGYNQMSKDQLKEMYNAYHYDDPVTEIVEDEI